MSAVTHRRLFAFACVWLVALAGCSSSTESAPTASGKKTCADLQKCCDSASEPTKTACTAAVSGKNEDLCASSYTAMCASGGGGDGGTGEAGVTAEVSTQCAATCKSVASANCTKSAECAKQCETGFKDAKAKGCVNEWTSVTRCTTNATYTCAEDGSPTTNECANEIVAYSNCAR